MDLSKTMQEYFNELSSNSPTPGGGNVAALCGALSASLGTMVCNLTIGKKKYAEVESEMITLKGKLETYQKKFIELAQKDNEAFDNVMAAFKLPKESDQEKTVRANAIEQATIGAAEIPSEVIKNCYGLLPHIKVVVDKGNKNSLSDAGVAASLIKTSSYGAYLNVLINCASLNNQTIADEIRKRASILNEEIDRGTTLLLESIIKSLMPS
ncbi:MAG: cyclodeaminase/cyclohydrolase family protein [Bacteroidota bacterium]